MGTAIADGATAAFEGTKDVGSDIGSAVSGFFEGVGDGLDHK